MTPREIFDKILKDYASVQSGGGTPQGESTSPPPSPVQELVSDICQSCCLNPAVTTTMGRRLCDPCWQEELWERHDREMDGDL